MPKFFEKFDKPEKPSTETESEPKQEIKLETTTQSQNTNQQAPVVLKSELDAYVYERVKEQPANIEEIKVKLSKDYNERQNILALPKELEKFGKEYSFRWINKKKRSIDNALDVIGWTFVTKNFFQNLPKHLFTANGVIERGDAILAFMPRKQADMIRLRPAQISRERVKNTPVQDLNKWQDRGENYYKPDLAAAEKDNEVSPGMRVEMNDINSQNENDN